MTPDGLILIEQRIGARVLIFRTRLKLSANDLALRSGVHRNTIYRMENGQNCSIENLYRVAVALDVDLASLLC